MTPRPYAVARRRRRSPKEEPAPPRVFYYWADLMRTFGFVPEPLTTGKGDPVWRRNKPMTN